MTAPHGRTRSSWEALGATGRVVTSSSPGWLRMRRALGADYGRRSWGSSLSSVPLRLRRLRRLRTPGPFAFLHPRRYSREVAHGRVAHGHEGDYDERNGYNRDDDPGDHAGSVYSSLRPRSPDRRPAGQDPYCDDEPPARAALASTTRGACGRRVNPRAKGASVQVERASAYPTFLTQGRGGACCRANDERRTRTRDRAGREPSRTSSTT